MKTTHKISLTLAVATVITTGLYATCATNVDMGNHKIVNVSDPVSSQDVVNKRYLEAYMYETMKNKYIRDNSKEVVLDVTTNLMWQDNAAAASTQKQWVTTANYNAGDYSNTIGDTAKTYCRNLSLGGYADWRLPSKDELKGIVKSTVINPSISGVFQYTASSLYWSSTTYVGNVSRAWIVFFGNGNQSIDVKSYGDYVRCVRVGQ